MAVSRDVHRAMTAGNRATPSHGPAAGVPRRPRRAGFFGSFGRRGALRLRRPALGQPATGGIYRTPREVANNDFSDAPVVAAVPGGAGHVGAWPLGTGGFVAGQGCVVYPLWCVRSGLYCGRLWRLHHSGARAVPRVQRRPRPTPSESRRPGSVGNSASTPRRSGSTPPAATRPSAPRPVRGPGRRLRRPPRHPPGPPPPPA